MLSRGDETHFLTPTRQKQRRQFLFFTWNNRKRTRLQIQPAITASDLFTTLSGTISVPVFLRFFQFDSWLFWVSFWPGRTCRGVSCHTVWMFPLRRQQKQTKDEKNNITPLSFYHHLSSCCESQNLDSNNTEDTSSYDRHFPFNLTHTHTPTDTHPDMDVLSHEGDL